MENEKKFKHKILNTIFNDKIILLLFKITVNFKRVNILENTNCLKWNINIF